MRESECWRLDYIVSVMALALEDWAEMFCDERIHRFRCAPGLRFGWSRCDCEKLCKCDCYLVLALIGARLLLLKSLERKLARRSPGKDSLLKSAPPVFRERKQ